MLVNQGAKLFAQVRAKVWAMVVTRQPRDCVDRIRCPDINGLPSEVVILLHDSLVHIVRMRRGIEVTNRQVQSARQAAWGSIFLLAELRRQGF